MNNTDTNTNARIHEIIAKGTSGAIILPQNPTPDAISASTALYLGLTKLGKNVSLVCSGSVQSDLIGADKIQQNLVTSGNNLIVSFPYTDGAIDKVDYNIQGENFNLIIAPRQGYPKLDPQQVKFSYTGGNLDFVITIDSPTLQSLGAIYADNQSQFQGHDIINIDRHLTNAFYGTINHVNKTASSVSELILQILKNLRVEIDKDIATNLYAGIGAATNNFTSYSVNADTFESIAQLLRAGAVKKTIRRATPSIQQPIMQQNKFQANRPANQQTMRQPIQTTQQQPMRQPTEAQENEKPIEVVEKEVNPEESTPQEWLKPKIFRGSGLI